MVESIRESESKMRREESKEPDESLTQSEMDQDEGMEEPKDSKRVRDPDDFEKGSEEKDGG